MKEAIDRSAVLSAMLRLANDYFDQAHRELGPDYHACPDATLSPLIETEGRLPGCVIRAMKGSGDEVERQTLIAELRGFSPLAVEEIALCFPATAGRYPGWWRYVMLWECMRLYALETLARGNKTG